jgi:hypothetical protein
MTQKDDLKEFNLLKLDVQDKFSQITGEPKEFPKYTTQLINLANQNSQGTRPEVVGQMSELIQQCPQKSFKGWKEWYLQNHPDSIKKATARIAPMIENMRKAMDLIDEDMIKEWVEDLVVTKTAEGLIIQEIILETIANQQGLEWRLATPEEESKNIDGFIGTKPVSVKPETYLSKKSSVREEIDIELIYYKKTAKYLYIYTKLD